MGLVLLAKGLGIGSLTIGTVLISFSLSIVLVVAGYVICRTEKPGYPLGPHCPHGFAAGETCPTCDAKHALHFIRRADKARHPKGAPCPHGLFANETCPACDEEETLPTMYSTAVRQEVSKNMFDARSIDTSNYGSSYVRSNVICRKCSSPMTLIDKGKQEWYCRKDGSIYSASEDYWLK